MGTRSTITARMADGTYASIYCHWDGYPSHNGKILHENYDTQEKVEALIALGDLSSLRESPACPEGHSYRTPVAGYCIAYGRDRGEADTAARRGSSLDMLRHREQYNYLWNGQAWLMDGMPLADVRLDLLSLGRLPVAQRQDSTRERPRTLVDSTQTATVGRLANSFNVVLLDGVIASQKG